jgi:hypothetical protein
LFEAINEFKKKVVNYKLKLNNFLSSTSFILIPFQFEVVFKFCILNLTNSDAILRTQMILNEKVVNYKVS